jgi:hypothetical protein
LSTNRLRGSIPPELGRLTALVELALFDNRLEGPVPAELGGLERLQSLLLSSNRLRGDLPVQLTSLSSLRSLNLRWNALYASDPAVWAFIEARQAGWSRTQTIAPLGVAASAVDESSIQISWEPVSFTSFPGGYEVGMSTERGGPYETVATVAGKASDNVTLSDLTWSAPYFFVVRTYTDPHSYNRSRVVSDPSPEVIAVGSPVEVPGFAGE